jgi:hypothetical protein
MSKNFQCKKKKKINKLKVAISKTKWHEEKKATREILIGL